MKTFKRNLAGEWERETLPTWKVTFCAPGCPSLSFTFVRRTPGEAVTAFWTELQSLTAQADFLQAINVIRVEKIRI